MPDDKKITAHIDYATQDSAIPENGPDRCPMCGKELEAGYGMAGGGMGVYMYCPEHGIFSKTQTD